MLRQEWLRCVGTPSLKLGRDIYLVVEVVGILEPDETVHLKRVIFSFIHDLVECESINYVATKGDVSVPSSRCHRIAVFLFSHSTNIGFWSGFGEIGYINGRINPVRNIKVEDRVVRRGRVCLERQNDGIGVAGHGGFQQENRVGKVLESGRRTERSFEKRRL